MIDSMKQHLFVVVVVLVAIIIFPAAAGAATYYVPDNYGTIQAAIDGVSDTDTIIVRDGTYTGSQNKNLDFGGKAIILESENGPDNCIIDCEDDGRGFYFHNGETSDSVVDGFTVIDGLIQGTPIFPGRIESAARYQVSPDLSSLSRYLHGGAASAGDLGAGIYCSESSPTIRNCVITNCSAGSASIPGAGGGGGMYFYASSSTITNCSISDNEANGFITAAGGIFAEESTLTIAHCTIDNNSCGASGGGGGILCNYPNSMEIIGCVISGNTAGSGGGIFAQYGSLTITNCTIIQNSADFLGGGAIFSENESDIYHCTFGGNSAGDLGGGLDCYTSTVSLSNCILWGDSCAAGPELALQMNALLSVSNSDIQGGQAAIDIQGASLLDWGAGNIDLNPVFVGVDNYHLAAGSPCIDTGTDIGIYEDIDGNIRPNGAGYDMGSDEYAGGCPYLISPADASFDVAGGTDSVNVMTLGGCAWTATSNKSWITITSGQSGAGNGVVHYSVAPNPDPESRIGTMIIAARTFTVNQAGTDCSYALSPEEESFDSVGGSNAVSITTDSHCLWASESNDAWVTVTSGHSGAGNGLVQYSVSSNPNPEPRVGSMTIAAIKFAIYQAGTAGDIYLVPDDYPTIKEALNDIPGGNMIIVRDGIYTGSSNRNLSFHGKAITLRSENGPENCVIDGEAIGGGFRFESGETDSAIVDGFTIKNGAADNGGGINCENSSSPTIINCVLTDNYSLYDGGGISCDQSSPVIKDCEIIANIAYNGSAGGIYCDESSPTIDGCLIAGNAAFSNGGGIGVFYSSAPDIVNCVISGNDANRGGGIVSFDSAPTIKHCTITLNSAGLYGGGIHSMAGASPTVTNCIIWGNQAEHNGSQLSIISTEYPSSLTVNYSDVEGGQAVAYIESGCTLNWGPGNIDSDPLFANAPVFYDHTGGDGTTTRASVKDDSLYSIGDTIEINGDGITRAVLGIEPNRIYFLPATPDPVLYPSPIANFGVDGSLPADYHLQASSPCIDVGTDAGIYTDFDGETRPQEAGFDMGADEFKSPSLSRINLQSPLNGASLDSRPTFTWMTDGGANNVYAVDFSIPPLAPFFSTYSNLHILISEKSWEMPQLMWILIPNGWPVYWRARGVDLADPPPSVIASDEIWSFSKM